MGIIKRKKRTKTKSSRRLDGKDISALEKLGFEIKQKTTDKGKTRVTPVKEELQKDKLLKNLFRIIKKKLKKEKWLEKQLKKRKAKVFSVSQKELLDKELKKVEEQEKELTNVVKGKTDAEILESLGFKVKQKSMNNEKEEDKRKENVIEIVREVGKDKPKIEIFESRIEKTLPEPATSSEQVTSPNKEEIEKPTSKEDIQTLEKLGFKVKQKPVIIDRSHSVKKIQLSELIKKEEKLLKKQKIREKVEEQDELSSSVQKKQKFLLEKPKELKKSKPSPEIIKPKRFVKVSNKEDTLRDLKGIKEKSKKLKQKKKPKKRKASHSRKKPKKDKKHSAKRDLLKEIKEVYK